MKKLLSKEFIIGACVIVALIILFFGIDFLKGINIFRPANFYMAYYDNVAGLEVAAPVTIDGYKVGQVREINFDYEKPGRIEVLLALDNKLRIPADSRASLGSSLMGSGFVTLTLGHEKRFIEVGGTIPTDVKPDLFSSLANNVLPGVAGTLTKVDTLLYSLNLLASNPALYKTIGRLDGISGNLLSATSGLDNTMNRDIPAIMAGAGNTISGLNSTLGGVNKVVGNVDTLTANLGVLSYQLKTLPLNSTMENVEATTQNLRYLSQTLNSQLNSKESSLGMLMNDPQLYQNLARVSADIDSLLIDIQKNPKRYVSIKLF